MTTFKGHKTGFNKSGSNDVTPNAGATTVFKGRGAVPGGKLQRYPGGAADISNGNRRLAKGSVGDGGGSGTTFTTHTAFGKGKK